MFAVVLYLERFHVFGLDNIFLELPALVAVGGVIYCGGLLLFFRRKTLKIINEFKSGKKQKKKGKTPLAEDTVE